MNQSVLMITGGSQGLGEALVRDALEQKCIVATCSRQETDFIRHMRDVDPEERRFYWQSLDVKDATASKAFVKAVIQRYGQISGLVNNAGISQGQFLSLTRDEMAEDLIAVNLMGVIRMTRLVLPHMLRQNQGSIINIGSISGKRGFAGMSLYGATKSGLEGFSRCLAREVGSRNVRVNLVAPGLIETKMLEQTPDTEQAQIKALTPMGRLGRPEDVVGLIRFLLSDEAAFITGQSIVVDGGFTC